MKIAVWKTGHQIADTVAESVSLGFSEGFLKLKSGIEGVGKFTTNIPNIDIEDDIIPSYDIHIGYGILRGMDEVFRASDKAGKHWFNIDRGYFKPCHFDGYYRISYKGTQQTTGLDRLEPDYARLEQLGIEILPYRGFNDGGVLYCPPTHHAAMFFGKRMMIDANSCGHKLTVRRKEMNLPLQPDLDGCSMVYTFNSSVGWEALRQGIPVASDPYHSICGAYQKLVDKMLYQDYEERRKLFAIMASLQLTLAEIRNGLLWPIIQKLLSLSDMTKEKKSQSM